MAAPLDDSIGKLESFIAVLTDASGKVDKGTDALEEHAQDLTALQQKARGDLEGFERELETGRDETATAADDAVEKIEALESAASDVTSDRLGDMHTALGDAGESYGEVADDTVSAVKDARDSAKSDGFDELGEALKEADDALDQARTASEQAFDQFASQLSSLAGRFEGNLVKASEKAKTAAEDASTLDSQVEGKGKWVADDLEGHATAAAATYAPHAQQFTQLYEGQEAGPAGEKLIEKVGTLLAEATDAVRTGANEPLIEPVDLILNDCLSPAAAELMSWVESAFMAKGSVSEFGSLVDDIKSAQQVMAAVARALDELGQ
jgi:uncharacterized phage infection (PIP) family protein YhgE